jgi:hypothetical protein
MQPRIVRCPALSVQQRSAASERLFYSSSDCLVRACFYKLCNSDQFFHYGTVIFELGLLLTVQP